MAGRTTSKHIRIYGNGYTLCNYARQIGPLTWTYDPADLTTMCDNVKGYLANTCQVDSGTLNGVFDNTATSGLHVLWNGATQGINLMVPIGDKAAPAAGDPVWMMRARQTSYQAADDAGAVIVTANLPAWDTADLPAYDIPWGVLSHAYGAETAANSGTGIDGSAATSLGGYMMYQVFAGNGTATISIDDSANNIAFAACAGLTTGELNFSTPQAGIIELGKTATIRQYTRWQLSLNSATSVTFALALVRGR